MPPPEGRPPPLGATPETPAGVPPVLSRGAGQRAAFLRRFVAGLSSFCLALFLADAVFSLVADSLVLLFGIRLFMAPGALISALSLLLALLVYLLMGLTPMIPKRFFLPLALFVATDVCLSVLVAIIRPGWQYRADLLFSACQLALGLGLLRGLQGAFRLRWPLVPEARLGPRSFSWRNLIGFLAVNLCALLAGTAGLGWLTMTTVKHVSAGFLALRPGGISVTVRRYVRDDGKSVLLVPMAHIGEADFYHKVSRALPTNSVVLMEGVTDTQNLITNRLTYQRAATRLGLAQQDAEFNPVVLEMVMADMDVSQFTPETVGMLNILTLIHVKGLNARTLPVLLSFSPPPDFRNQLFDDILHKRNQHLLKELQVRLPDSKFIVVPWGVAHMPGIAEGVTASGFRLAESTEYTVIRFHLPGSRKRPKAQPAHGAPA